MMPWLRVVEHGGKITVFFNSKIEQYEFTENVQHPFKEMTQDENVING